MGTTTGKTEGTSICQRVSNALNDAAISLAQSRVLVDQRPKLPGLFQKICNRIAGGESGFHCSSFVYSSDVWRAHAIMASPTA